MVFGPKQVDLEHRSEFQDLRSKQQDSAHLLTKSGPEEVFQEIRTFWSIWICLYKSIGLICALSCDVSCFRAHAHRRFARGDSGSGVVAL